MKLEPDHAAPKSWSGKRAQALYSLAHSCVTPMHNEINAAYEGLYGKSIQVTVKSELHGDYEKVLVQLVDAPCE